MQKCRKTVVTGRQAWWHEHKENFRIVKQMLKKCRESKQLNIYQEHDLKKIIKIIKKKIKKFEGGKLPSS